MKGGDAYMTIFESLTIMLSFASLVVAILSFDNNKK
ncbi:putative holin-like toxin [Ferdinandcohnia sp. Marseille-Q9671]